MPQKVCHEIYVELGKSTFSQESWHLEMLKRSVIRPLIRDCEKGCVFQVKKKSNPLYSKMALPSLVEIGLVILENMGFFFTFTEGPSVNVKKPKHILHDGQ